jgi:phosphate transport system substrate-binding protein
VGVIVLVGGAVCAGAYFSQPYWLPYVMPTEKAAEGVQLQTGGTSSADLVIKNCWKAAYQKDKKVEVAYKSVGSTQGVEQLIEGEFPIAFTHAPVTKAQREKAQRKGGEIIQFPVVFCSVVPIYNLPGLKGKPAVKFTGAVLADIFLGKITRWDDQALQDLNKNVKLPDTKITVVHRKDSSGTTFLFSGYLAGASPAWREKFGEAGKSSLKWPAGVGAERSTGLVKKVVNTEGAIGYADLVYAYFGTVQYGAVQNKAGEFIHANTENMTAAVEDQPIPDDLALDLMNRPGKEAYPVCGALWAVVYRKQPEETRQEVVDFLQWVTHEGQALLVKQGMPRPRPGAKEPPAGKRRGGSPYATLPKPLVTRVEKQIQRIGSAS